MRLGRGLDWLREWGLRVVFPDGMLGAEPLRNLAGTDRERAVWFQAMLRDPEVDLLMATRGGYGCARLLPFLDWDLMASNTKPVLGYSDLTALHAALTQRRITTGVWGPMAAVDFPPLGDVVDAGFAWSMQCLEQVLTVSGGGVRVPGRALRTGEVSGWILPCTLSLLTSLIGTPYLRSLEGAVLLLEDIHEAAHEIDRNLTQLLQAGLLQGIRALGFGRFTEAADSERIPSVLEEFGRALDVPVALDLEFGHGPGGACLPVGRSVTAEVMEDGTHLVWAGGHRS